MGRFTHPTLIAARPPCEEHLRRVAIPSCSWNCMSPRRRVMVPAWPEPKTAASSSSRARSPARRSTVELIKVDKRWSRGPCGPGARSVARTGAGSLHPSGRGLRRMRPASRRRRCPAPNEVVDGDRSARPGRGRCARRCAALARRRPRSYHRAGRRASTAAPATASVVRTTSSCPRSARPSIRSPSSCSSTVGTATPKEVTIRVGNRTGERLVMVEGSTFGDRGARRRAGRRRRRARQGKASLDPRGGGRPPLAGLGPFVLPEPSRRRRCARSTRCARWSTRSATTVRSSMRTPVSASSPGTVGEGRPVHAIERGKDSVADARVNLNGADTKIIRSSVERWRPSPAAVVMADPAREGLGKDGVAALMRAEPASVRARELRPVGVRPRREARSSTPGMALDRMTVVDMFPGTSHVETVGAFVSRP